MQLEFNFFIFGLQMGHSTFNPTAGGGGGGIMAPIKISAVKQPISAKICTHVKWSV